MRTLHINLLKIGAFQTAILAVYHFFIPFQYNWSKFLSDGTQTINWSLYALNNYFSFNLFVVSLFLMYHLLLKKDRLHTIKVLSIIATLFWCFSAVYQVIAPMPLPKTLTLLSYILPGLAFINITIFIVPLQGLFRSKLI